MENRFIEMQVCRNGEWVVEGVEIPRDTPEEKIKPLATESMIALLRTKHGRQYDKLITYVGVYNIPQLTER